MTKEAIVPYLFYSGRCDEAIAFYERELGAKLEIRMTFNESPVPLPPGMLQEGFESKVMHATLKIGSMTVYMADGCDDKPKFDGFNLAIQVETEEEAHRYFNALAKGGSIRMPLCATFWSPCYGMVSDQFNVGWMVMIPGPADPTI